MERSPASPVNMPKAKKKQTLRWNSFGWNPGRPIFFPGIFNADKNKFFFFTSTEFNRLWKENPQFWNVPTVTQRSGDFSDLASSAWYKDSMTGQAFPGGIIPATRFSKNSKRLLDHCTVPN
jgi:hypothetical protein